MKLIKLFPYLFILALFSCTEPKIETDQAAVEIPAVPEVNEKITAVVETTDSEKKETEIKEELKPEPEPEKTKSKSKPKEKSKAKKKREKKIKKSSGSKTKSEEKKSASDLVITKDSEPSSNSGNAIMTFNELIHDFGVITQGDKIEHKFVFENTGDSDLEIMKVDVTCGCTTPTFPFLPIPPGEKGAITVSYNSTGKLGNQKPMITVITNANPKTHKIYFKGVVDAKRANSNEEEAEEKPGN